jgi:hypothetical protein
MDQLGGSGALAKATAAVVVKAEPAALLAWA